MPVTTQGLMSYGMPAGAARYISENASPGSSPAIVVLDVPAGGPYPVPMVTPDYANFVEWANVNISDNAVFAYENGVITALREMFVLFGMNLNFAAADTQLIQARVHVSSSAVDFAGCVTGAGVKEAISVTGVCAVAPGATLAAQLLDPDGPGVFVMEESALWVCGLVQPEQI